MGNVKQELTELKKRIQGEIAGLGIGTKRGGIQGSYANVIKERKKENIIIVRPKVEQESELTKKLVKEKINIRNGGGHNKAKKR